MKKFESDRLLRDCRDLLTNRMRASMSKMMGDIEDTLFEMATSGGANDQGSYYIDAVREVRMKKREIQVRFENRFLDLFDSSVQQIQHPIQDRVSETPASFRSAGIIDINHARTDGFEQRIERMRNECRSALGELDKHFSSLLQAVPATHFDNPLQPQTVFNAFQESCRDFQVGPDIRQLLMDMFDKHVGPALRGVYADLNTLFQSYDSTQDQHPVGLDINANSGMDNPYQSLEPHVGLSSLLVGHWIRDKVLLPQMYADIPQFIREFVLGPWSLVLERIYERQGITSTEWTRALQIVTDLQICTLMTADREKRRQQIWMLPGLIYRLKSGMKHAVIPLKQQADFLSQLKAHHARITESAQASGSPN